MKKLLVLVALIVGQSALAQHVDPFDFHVADLELLQSKKIQSELGVTPAVHKKFESYAAEYRKSGETYYKALQAKGVDPANNTTAQEKFKSFVERLKTQVMGCLSASQLKRLRELSLQHVGSRGLLDPVVAQRLGLTKKESTAIEAVFKVGQTRNEKLVRSIMEPINKKYSTKKPTSQQEADLLRAQANMEAKNAMEKAKPIAKKIQNETESEMRKAVSAKSLAILNSLKGKPSKAIPTD